MGSTRALAQEGPGPDTTAIDSTWGAGYRGEKLEAQPLTRLPSGDDRLPIARLAMEQASPRGASADSAMQGPPASSPDTGRVARYFRSSPRRAGGLYEPRSPLLGPRSPSERDRSISLDSTGFQYVLEGGAYTDGSMRLDAETYRRENYRANLRENWTTLVEQRQQQRNRRGGVGVSMTVPGGRESAFTTIFGKPEVDLRVNGQADINAGFKYNKNDQQGARTGDATQLDPDFKQDLRLGITGTIGDKMQINVDWDTNNQFDYQNQVKLEYTGYEDEIIQSVEAGNVFLETPSQLISGGQSLFGIKSSFQVGNLNLTTIASQQEGQSNSLSIEGGSETTEFSLQPTDYDENTHFFLGYYFRNNWNRAHQDPTSITLSDGFNQITDIEVWKLQTSTGTSGEDEVRRVAATVDLGEAPELLAEADEYTAQVLPLPDRDQYSDDDLAELRDGETSVSSYLESGANLERPLQTQDWESGKFKKLEQGRDYQLDPRLGFVSLKQRLRPNEALAVAYRFQANGEEIEIGDFSQRQGGTTGGVREDRLALKLLRPTNPVAPGPNATDEPAAWFLELRNIYRLSGRSFTADNFELDLQYNPSGQGATPVLSAISTEPLLQVLGLDRQDQSGAPTPDNEFDFTSFTINPEEGLIYFPYLEPFGERILEFAEANGSRSDGEPFAFENLYVKKKTNAEQEDTERNVYEIEGAYKGQQQGFYDLQAFSGLVEGSVEVTSGGQSLEEGADYVVDYQSGTVNITNQTYLVDGRTIDISYEQQSIANLQKKTLLGARADWSLRDQFSLGATVMRLSQKSPVDKYRIGEEPIKNTIWGMDGSMDLQPRWLTRAVDALPLVETRAESSVSLSGEFAQLRPGHTRTEAFEQTIERVDDSETDSYAADERSGISYIDDFEGFENSFSLREQLGAWQISAAPDSIGPAPSLDGTGAGSGALARTQWRGSLSWYQLSRDIREDLEGKVAQRGDAEATERIQIRDVFPDRDTRGQRDQTLRTFDMYFNPWQRGPYNYLDDGRNLVDFVRSPTQVWGGITRQLPEGYTDFSVQNVEFVEFIVKPYPENGEISEGAKLFVNLGTISEDVIPNEELNTEDGLSLNFNEGNVDNLGLSRLAGGGQDDNIDVRDGRTEDLGLDGLASYTLDSYDAGLLERNFYDDFVARADSLRDEIGQLGLSSAQRERLEAEVARINEDPSADDYHHYENDNYFETPSFFPDGATLQDRFSRYYAGHELNSYEAQNQLAEDVSVRRGVTGEPDTEDLSGAGGQSNSVNDYFQYAIPLDSLDARAGTDEGPTDYVVSKVGANRDWYKIRIPVREFTDRVGNARDFTRIESIRMWTMGHETPVTMRFASLELVGSQWRRSSTVAQQPVENETVMDEGEGELRVASISTDEDPNYEAPDGAVVSRSRTSTGAEQRDSEQSLLLNIDELGPGQQRGINKTFQQGLDLLKYSNLRMYTHVHSTTNGPQGKEKIRENLRLFVRLGANETTDYYEYEQPLEPSNRPGTGGATSPWLQENEMNLVLSMLSQLKTARDQSGVRPDTTYTSDEVNLPLDFAPEGTRLKIRGTPSLDGVNTVVIGVRHVGEPPSAPQLRNLELWVNELRVSGFDERSGWATTSSANVSLADLATVRGSFQQRTDGFGSLSSTLDEREQSDNTSWSVRSDVNLDALLPEEQGWRIPVTMQLQSSLVTPRFDPERGDIRISEVQRTFENLTDEEIDRQFGPRYPDRSLDQIRETLKDSVRRASESYNVRRTVTASLEKSGSESWWLRNTMDATSLSFSYFDRTARSPQRLLDDQWNWSGSFEYQLSFGQARTVRPLGFLPTVPILGLLSDVEFNYVPTSFSFSGNAKRELTTTRSRPSGRSSDPRPARVANPFRENQNFDHRRNFSLQYDPFEFLGLSFDTQTRETLTDLAGRTQRNMIFSDSSVVGRRTLTDVDTSAVFNNPQRFGLPGQVDGDQLRGELGSALFVEDRLRQKSEGEVLRDILHGAALPRTESYRQRLSATLQFGILDRQALNWIDVQDLSYQSSFNWNNGAKGSLKGASVENSVTLRSGVSLHPNRVWERFGFYERMKEAQRESEQEDESTDGGSSEEEGAKEGETTGEDQETDDRPGWEDLPLPSPVDLLRRMALTVLDINDITVNYDGDRSSRSSNIGSLVTNASGDPTGISTAYSLLDAMRGEGPSLRYRLGLDRSIAASKRVFEEAQVIDNLTNRHRFEARTALTPSSAFNIDLNWNVTWTTQPQTDYQRRTDDSPTSGSGSSGPIRRFQTERGDASASVWAFGSYQSFFERQLETFRRNVESTAEAQPARDVAFTQTSVVDDFREAYLTGNGRFGPNGVVPVPMPGWTVRYSGLSDWPLIDRVAQSVSLNHSYNAEYESGFQARPAGDAVSIRVAGETLNFIEADFEPQSVQIREQFQPLIGMDVTWPWDLQTSLEWNQRVTTALRGKNVVERETGELSGRISYSKRGLQLPFFSRIENRIQFSLTLTRSVSDEREYFLEEALQEARSNLDTYDPSRALEGENVNPLTETTRLTMSPTISYSVSNQVTADFRLDYERFDGYGRQPSYTNVNGSFNISVNISQN